MPAAITGVGLVTALGSDADQTWQSLLAGKHITDHTRVEPSAQRPTPRIASLAIQAAKPAIAHAGWTRDCEDIAVIACTSKGSVENWIDSSPSPLEHGYGLSDLSTLIARQIGSTDGPRLTFSAACAGGLHGLIRGAMLIQSGHANRVLVVAAEASVHPLFLNSFQRLGVLPPAGELCRPFDRRRSGFLMSDAAAAVCLESSTATHALARIERFALGGDATHLTGSDPHGKVLRHLLNHVIGEDAIDLFHAHGTGTIINDQTEISALNSSLKQKEWPSLFSHKAALGHSLGASGLVSVVLNCLCHQHQLIPPNINTTDPIEMGNILLHRSVENRAVLRSVIHAAGFGGSTAVVSLSSIFNDGLHR